MIPLILASAQQTPKRIFRVDSSPSTDCCFAHQETDLLQAIHPQAGPFF